MDQNQSVHWVTEPSGYLEPKIGSEGFASIPATTIVRDFQNTVLKHGNRNALAAKLEIGGSEIWKFWTYKQYYDECERFAMTLIHLQVERFSIINILGFKKHFR